MFHPKTPGHWFQPTFSIPDFGPREKARRTNDCLHVRQVIRRRLALLAACHARHRSHSPGKHPRAELPSNGKTNPRGDRRRLENRIVIASRDPTTAPEGSPDLEREILCFLL